MILSGKEIQQRLGKDLHIEPFSPSQVNPTKLWESYLHPDKDGLGNTLFVNREENGVQIYGRGTPIFRHEHSIASRDIIMHHEGRNATVDKEFIIWSCFVTKKEIKVGEIPKLVGKLSEISRWYKRAGVGGIVITATADNAIAEKAR